MWTIVGFVIVFIWLCRLELAFTFRTDHSHKFDELNRQISKLNEEVKPLQKARLEALITEYKKYGGQAEFFTSDRLSGCVYSDRIFFNEADFRKLVDEQKVAYAEKHAKECTNEPAV